MSLRMKRSRPPSDPTEPHMLGTARFRAIIGMDLLIMMGFGLIIPALPEFVKQLGHNEAAVAAVVFGFALTRLMGDFFVGWLIDHFGERVVTAAGAAIVGVSSITAGLARSYGQLLVLRGLGGFGSSFFLGGLMAYLIAKTPVGERGRAMSIFQGSFGLGLLIGPAVGGAMLAFASPRVPFYIYGGALVLVVPFILRTIESVRGRGALADAPDLPTEEVPAPRVPGWRQLRPLLSSSAYVAALASGALLLFLSTAEITILKPYWTDVLHQGNGTSGLPFTIAGVFGIAVIWHAGTLTDRRGRKSALLPALVVTAIGYAAIGQTHSPIAVLALLALTGLMAGYMRPGPSAIVADVSSPETRGAAVAGFRFAGDFGALIGPVGGVVAQYASYAWAWAALGISALLVFVLALFAQETLPR
ncbi:MAG: MFS transporter [Actinomycetota bacterium]